MMGTPFRVMDAPILAQYNLDSHVLPLDHLVLQLLLVGMASQTQVNNATMETQLMLIPVLMGV